MALFVEFEQPLEISGALRRADGVLAGKWWVADEGVEAAVGTSEDLGEFDLPVEGGWRIYGTLRDGRMTVPVGRGRDALPGPDPGVSPTGVLAATIEDRILPRVPADATLAVVPQGTLLNSLTRRPTPTPYHDLMPPIFATSGSDRILAAYEAQLPAAVAKFEANASRTAVWTPLEPKEMKSIGKATFTKQKDNSILVTGPNVAPETYTITFETKMDGITGIRLEALPDKSLPAQGPGRAQNGNFVLNEFKVDFIKTGESGKAKNVKLVRPQATFSQDGLPIANVVDNNIETGWVVAPVGKPHVAVFDFKQGRQEGVTITVSMVQSSARTHSASSASRDHHEASVQPRAVPENIAKMTCRKTSTADQEKAPPITCVRSIKALVCIGGRLPRAAEPACAGRSRSGVGPDE